MTPNTQTNDKYSGYTTHVYMYAYIRFLILIYLGVRFI